MLCGTLASRGGAKQQRRRLQGDEYRPLTAATKSNATIGCMGSSSNAKPSVKARKAPIKGILKTVSMRGIGLRGQRVAKDVCSAYIVRGGLGWG